MTILYLDHELGDDGDVTPLGWWKVAFDGGSGAAPTAGDLCTGATSGHSGYLTVVGSLSSGSWAGNDAVGFLYFYGVDDLFHNAEQIDWHDGHCHTTAAAVYCAWKTFTSGATSGRVAPGDIIRCKKSPAPTSIGNATWTSLSKIVTLNSAQTLTIDLCETAWVGAGDTTVIRDSVGTDGKQGSYCMRLTLDSSPQINILQAYYEISELDLHTYQKISFWIKNSAAVVANNWKVCLCSDTVGAVVVDTFSIPATPSTVRWIAWTLARDGGGNLGASIKSIAIYTGSAAPTASSYIRVDDFIACTTDGLNLQSFISKSSLEYAGGSTEAWYPIQSINGVTVLIDNSPNTRANVGRGYYTTGTTPEAVETYKRETIKLPLQTGASSSVNTISESGTAGLRSKYTGGWNPVDNTQDGDTFLDHLNALGYVIQGGSGRNWVEVNRFTLVNGYSGLVFTLPNYCIASEVSALGNDTAGASLDVNQGLIDLDFCNNNGTYGVSVGGRDGFVTGIKQANNNLTDGIRSGDRYITYFTQSCNNDDFGLVNDSLREFRDGYTDGNGQGGISQVTASGEGLFRNITIDDAVESAGHYGSDTNEHAYCQKLDGAEGNNWIFYRAGTINSLATTRPGGSGLMWRMIITAISRTSNYPLPFKIATIACTGNKEVTVKAWVQKGHATNIECILKCAGKQIAGVDSDVTDEKFDDTSWEELSISFTPTVAGVVDITIEAYCTGATANAYCNIEDMTITEAA